MNVQISVTVWTVICFAALYLILNNLLFKPMLRLMDGREKKIADAAAAKTAAVQALEEQRIAAQAQQDEQARLAREQAKADAERVRLEGKQLLEDAKKDRLVAVEEFRTRMETEYAQELQVIDTQADEAAGRFLANLFAD